MLRSVVTDEQWISAVARELRFVEQTLRNWVKAAEAGKLNGASAKEVTPEQMKSPDYGRKTSGCNGSAKS